MVVRTALVGLVVGLTCCASSPSPEGAGSAASQAGGRGRGPFRDHVLKANVHIPMRDGKSLAADVWMPRKEGRVPAILFMTPYSRKNAGAPMPDKNLELELPDVADYATVLVDWRGFFGSRKAGAPTEGIDQHGQDGHDVVEWIAAQSWSDGKVAMWGASGPGRVQFAVAATKPPHLVAIAPLVAADGFYYDMFYHGGVLRKAYVDMLGTVGFGAQHRARQAPATENDFWQKIEETTAHTEKIDVPVLMISGWYDLSVDSILDTFVALRRGGGPRTGKTIKLFIGPWVHVSLGKRRQGDLEFPEAEGVSAALSTQFFDHYVRGEKNGWDQHALFTYLRMGRNEWHASDRFPPKTGGTTRFYLAEEAGLSEIAPESRRGSVSFVYDPEDPAPTIGGMTAFIGVDPNYERVGSGPRDQRPVLKRKDTVVFTSPVLERDVVLEGHALAKLFVSSNRVDTDVAVRLADVYPDERSILITDGIQRTRFREGARESLMKPGEIYQVEVKLFITAHTFQKGHRIQIIVSSSNYPMFDLNHNVDRPRLLGPKSVEAENAIHFDRDHPSELSLPRWADVERLDPTLIEPLRR